MPPGVTVPSAVAAAAAAIDGRPVDPACDPAVVVERAILHRVSALVAASPWAASLPAADAARLAEDARLGSLHGALLDRELEQVLAALADRGLSVLVTKGAQLAHVVYESPGLRSRADTDVLVFPEQTSAVAAVLAECGYARSVRTSGSVILGQIGFERRLRAGVVHYVDVHWRAAAPLMFQRALDTRGIAAAAQPIAGLGPHARGPALPDALALACIHLVAHHWHQILLVWLEDMRLLAEALDDAGRQRLVERATAGAYTVVVDRALRTARLYFDSRGLDRAIASVSPHVNDAEAAAALVREGRRKVDDLWLDLRHAGWRDRARLVREHVLPPADYLRARFDGPVPLAYAKRVLLGVRKWF